MELRVQVIYILQDVYGEYFYFDPNVGFIEEYEFWYEGEVYDCSPPQIIIERFGLIHETLCREYGVFTLGNSDVTTKKIVAVVEFFPNSQETDRTIDVLELSFQHIDRYVRENANEFENQRISPDKAIAKLNHCFRENGVGYQYESGQIIRVDSQLIHTDVVRPALLMLADPMYEGANAEFLSAHEHYRKGRFKECLNDCLKAFESCIKVICKKRGWAYTENDTASGLIALVFDEGLIPTFMQSHFTGLRSTLESGVSTVRNKLSGHGQGAEEISVLDYIAAYALHLTASNILLLAKADEEG